MSSAAVVISALWVKGVASSERSLSGLSDLTQSHPSAVMRLLTLLCAILHAIKQETHRRRKRGGGGGGGGVGG